MSCWNRGIIPYGQRGTDTPLYKPRSLLVFETMCGEMARKFRATWLPACWGGGGGGGAGRGHGWQRGVGGGLGGQVKYSVVSGGG